MRMARITLALSLIVAPRLAAEAQLIRAGDLPNLAKGATAAASLSASDYEGKFGPPMAVDGRPSTRWVALGADLPVWVELTFAEQITLDTVIVEQCPSPRLYANAERIVLAFSEGGPIELPLRDSSGPQVLRFQERTTRSLRLTIPSSYGQKTYVSVTELSIYHDPHRTVEAVISPREHWGHPELTAHGRSEHPCVNKTRTDIQRARANMARYPWLAEWVRVQQAAADEWLARSDEWIISMIPQPGACFAYGFTGCPICGAKWGQWAGARCSWDDPGYLTCANGHRLPDEEHPDSGTGYVGPGGRIHYMVGSWNAWVVENLESKALRPLCLTYLLSGDERYAQKAAVILDHLARIYPECDAGSWDYPSDPPSGRLCRPWYQAARVLIHYVDFYDELYHSPALDQPSSVERLSRRENIEQNLLLNGAQYCYEQSLNGGLNNGEADYIRGALAVGCVLGIEAYVDWALDGPYGVRSMIANNADRDGRYFESSLSYATSAISLYLTFAEPMLHYRSERYPQGIDLYSDPKFLSFYSLPQTLLDCAGHWPRYGDSAPDTARAFPSDPPPVGRDPGDYAISERIYARTSGALREPFAAAVALFAGGQGAARREQVGDRLWVLFHADEFPATVDASPLRERLRSTDFLGQKGVAILRGGEREEAQAALLRYGPSLNHGHFDDLNLSYYAGGYELTYDLGYGLASTHTQVGWAKQTASHNLVVVDEQRQHLPGSGSGGSLLLLDEMPGLRVVEAEARAAYGSLGLEQYRRLVALVGEGAERYLVDIFRVDGGSQHDYMLHALGDQLEVEGAALGEAEQGSLAGAEVEWGRLQGNDGDMIGFPNRPYWCPPPENGYGFLVDVRRGEAPAEWTALWEVDAEVGVRLRAIGLPEAGTELITATAPGIYPRFPRAAYICARRTGEDLSSTYATVLEPGSRIASAQRLEADPAGGVAVRVIGRHGSEDRLLSALDAVARDYGDGFAAAAQLARVRSDADGLVEANLLAGTELRTPWLTLSLPQASWRATVVRVDEAARQVVLDVDGAPIPQGAVLRGAAVYFSNPAYSRNSAYHVESVTEVGDQVRLRVREASFLLGKAVIYGTPLDAHTLTSIIPHDYARTMARGGQSEAGDFFAGKLLTGPNGAATTIREVVYGQPQTIRVDSASGFADGAECWYHDVQPGDEVVIYARATLSRTGPGIYRIAANTPVAVEAQGEVSWRTGNGAWRPAEGAIPTGTEIWIGGP